MATHGNSESPLIESVRKWVLQNLPSDPNDADLQSHLKGKDVSELLIIYQNWQSRLIPAQPRTAHVSSALSSKKLAPQNQKALAAIIKDIEAGNLLTKYLSRGLRIATSLPANNPALQRRRDLDLMLNGWGIHHLHLSVNVEQDGFVARDRSIPRQLLFAVFKTANAYLLDVMDHDGNWASKHLLETLVSEFPDSDSFYVLQGIKGCSHDEWDEDSLLKLRGAGVNVPVMIDGKAVLPASGMTTNGMSLDTIDAANLVLERVISFERNWTSNPEKIRAAVVEAGGTLPATPEFIFEVLETAGVGVMETQSKTFIPLL